MNSLPRVRELPAAETLPRTSYNTRFRGQKVPFRRKPTSCTPATAYKSGCRYKAVWGQILRASKVLARTEALVHHISSRKRHPWSRRTYHFRRCKLALHIRSLRLTVGGFSQPAGDLNTYSSSTPGSRICSRTAFVVCRRHIASPGHRSYTDWFSPSDATPGGLNF